MERFDLIELEARVVAAMGKNLFSVVLGNGHSLLARGEEVAAAVDSSLIGRTVLVRLRTFDLSSGQIVGLSEPPSAGQESGS